MKPAAPVIRSVSSSCISPSGSVPPTRARPAEPFLKSSLRPARRAPGGVSRVPRTVAGRSHVWAGFYRLRAVLQNRTASRPPPASRLRRSGRTIVRRSISLPTPRALVLFSGGLDSTTVLAIARNEGFDPLALLFDYGQRHRVELDRARAALERTATPWRLQ